MNARAPVVVMPLRQTAATPVIVGSGEDVHVIAVRDELERRDAQAVVIDADHLDAAGGLTSYDTTFSRATPRAWIRRLATPAWRRDAMPDPEDGVSDGHAHAGVVR